MSLSPQRLNRIDDNSYSLLMSYSLTCSCWETTGTLEIVTAFSVSEYRNSTTASASRYSRIIRSSQSVKCNRPAAVQRELALRNNSNSSRVAKSSSLNSGNIYIYASTSLMYIYILGIYVYSYIG